MKPIDTNVSPYLQQPLRTLEQVQQERARQQRQRAGDDQDAKPGAAPRNSAEGQIVPPKRIDQTI